MEAKIKRARVLIVDDEREIRNLLCELLEEDYECAQAASADEALALLNKQSFEIIVSDITMNGMNGLELVARVLKIAPEIVVVMVSGMQTLESAVESLRVGAFDYITKPFDLRHVEAVVKRAVECFELRAAKRRYENQLEELVAQRTAALDEALNSLEGAYRSTLQALTAALEARDVETRGHSERVVAFSLRLGRELGLTKERMKELEYGALLHDIGKIGVPDAILRKPRSLTEEEWALMREHTLYGQQILRGIAFLEGASRVVAQHHERWDGTGYPLGLSGALIDLNARIFAVADAFDAMTSDRVYRAGLSYEETAAEICKWAGRQFDPQVVAAFQCIPPEDWADLRRYSFNASRRPEMLWPAASMEQAAMEQTTHHLTLMQPRARLTAA